MTTEIDLDELHAAVLAIKRRDGFARWWRRVVNGSRRYANFFQECRDPELRKIVRRDVDEAVANLRKLTT